MALATMYADSAGRILHVFHNPDEEQINGGIPAAATQTLAFDAALNPDADAALIDHRAECLLQSGTLSRNGTPFVLVSPPPLQPSAAEQALLAQLLAAFPDPTQQAALQAMMAAYVAAGGPGTPPPTTG